MAKKDPKLHGAPAWVIAQGLSAWWDPINNRLKPGTPNGRPASEQAPAAPAQPDPNDPSLPWNAASAGQQAAIQRSLTDTQGIYNRQLGELSSAYGFSTPGLTDQAGNAITQDISNPYSKAAILQKTYDQRKMGVGNSYAAQGQLYAGSLSNAYKGQEENYLQNRSGLETDYKNRVQDLLDRRKEAGNQANERLAGIESDRVSQGLANAPDVNVADPTLTDFSLPAPGLPNSSKVSLSKKNYLKGLRARTTTSSRQRYRNKFSYKG